MKSAEDGEKYVKYEVWLYCVAMASCRKIFELSWELAFVGTLSLAPQDLTARQRKMKKFVLARTMLAKTDFAV